MHPVKVALLAGESTLSELNCTYSRAMGITIDSPESNYLVGCRHIAYMAIKAERALVKQRRDKGYLARHAGICMSPFVRISGPTNGACLGAVTIEILYRNLR